VHAKELGRLGNVHHLTQAYIAASNRSSSFGPILTALDGLRSGPMRDSPADHLARFGSEIGTDASGFCSIVTGAPVRRAKSASPTTTNALSKRWLV
jgi:hypothetical protein